MTTYGRVAPAADGDVAVRQREAFERRGVCAAHDLDAGARGMRQPVGVERLGAIEILPHLIGDSLLSVRGSIAELRSQRRPRAGIDAQRGRALGEQCQKVFADLIERGERIRLTLGTCRRPCGRCGRCVATAVQQWQRRRGGESRDRLAAVQQWRHAFTPSDFTRTLFHSSDGSDSGCVRNTRRSILPPRWPAQSWRRSWP